MVKQKAQYTIPQEIAYITKTLQKANFEAYLVGGCVRDLIMGITPKDWDITTNANPNQIQALFEKTFYENEYGTVGVVNEETKDPTLETVEVTPYRLESSYSDGRRPDSVVFGGTLEDDLKRRDFTMNAIAYDNHKGQIVDLHKGQDDIKDKVIRAVGESEKRFSEDALRVLRAVRLATELGFTINTNTKKAIEKTAHNIKNIAIERIRDEFTRIIMSKNPMQGLLSAHNMGLLQYIAPELEEGIDIEQNQAHTYSVWEHILHAVQAAADKDFSLEVRIAALFHDIAKPRTRARDMKKDDWSFHGHEVVGAHMTQRILSNLRFPKETVALVKTLVRWHMFFSDTEQITHAAVRRMVRNVGKKHIWELMNVRICDRVGTGRPKEQPYRFRKYKAMIEEVLRDPISVSMLKIEGVRIMSVTGETPGPKVGYILHALLEDVLDDPARNTKTYLENQAKKLARLPEDELKKLGEQGKEKKENVDEKQVQKIRKGYWVK